MTDLSPSFWRDKLIYKDIAEGPKSDGGVYPSDIDLQGTSNNQFLHRYMEAEGSLPTNCETEK